MSALLLSSLVTSYILNLDFSFVLIGYIIINVLYSINLKHISVLDFVIIALRFPLRVVAGGVVTGAILQNLPDQ